MRHKRFLAAIIVSLCLCSAAANAAEKPLQIVFMLGGPEMVGHAKVSTAEYMLQKPLIPPREITLNAHKQMPHQINSAYLYWRAMNAYEGPKKAELKKLIEERNKFKGEFKKHVLDELNKNNGMFRGKKYNKRRGGYRGFWMYNLIDAEAEKVGITPKIRAILDAPDNKFIVVKAYDTIIADINARNKKQQGLNKVFLKGVKTEDFAAPDQVQMKMPKAKRTYVCDLGDPTAPSNGILSVGFGNAKDAFGLEYAAGLALESKVDGPVLIVKCALNDHRSSIDKVWGPSSDGWKSMQSTVKAVLADPGKYHPGYDKKAGSNVAGLIWFQGLSDSKNSDYASHLEKLLTDFRELVKTPDMPIVCATVGDMEFKPLSDDHLANQGMRKVANKPAFKDRMSIVETYKFRPAEFGVIGGLMHKRKINKNSPQGQTMQKVISKSTGRGPYSGSAQFYLLAGNEVGEVLAKMINEK